MAKKVICETVQVTVTDEGGETITVTLPAYTRDIDDFKIVIDDHLTSYIQLSQLAGQQVSVGDFILRLIAVAAVSEPRSQ